MNPRELIEESWKWNPGWHIDRLYYGMSEEQRLTLWVGAGLILIAWLLGGGMKPPKEGVSG